MTDGVWKDAAVVARFADARAARVPESATQLAVLLHVLRSLPGAPQRILDLGAGDAVLLDALLDAFPESEGWKHFELALFGGFRPGPAACS